MRLTCNDSMFSFLPPSLDHANKLNAIKPDAYSEEILKEIAEEKVKEIYENRIKELERFNISLKDRIDRESRERFKQNREKDERISKLEYDVKMVKLHNERMLSFIDEMKDRNRKLAENVAELNKKNANVFIESFDFNFLGSNNSDNNAKVNCKKETNESYYDYIEGNKSLKIKSSGNQIGHYCKSEFERHDISNLDVFSERFFLSPKECELAKTNKTLFYDYRIPIKMFPLKKRNTKDNKIEEVNSKNYMNDSKIEEYMSKKEFIESNISNVCFIDYKNPYIEPKDFESVLILINDSNFIMKKI